jgi:serine/threonine protein kinase
MKTTYYFLFPWADGGNLRDFWKLKSEPSKSKSFLLDVLKQLHGLAEALEKLHGYVGKRDTFPENADDDALYHGSGGIRHGDLKPENILIFNSSGSSEIGTLKIADMGLAKHHEVSTKLRDNMTSTKYGTRRYEPPEIGVLSRATSRLYDTWSMGCIILEFVVWLLDKQDGLDAFNASIREGIKHDSEPPYYKFKEGPGSERVGIVHPLVAGRLSDLTRDVPRNSALGDLVAIVRDKLLIVNLPSSDEEGQERMEHTYGPTIIRATSPSTRGANLPCRVTAKALRESLSDILRKAQNNSSYVLTEIRPRPRQANIATPTTDGGGRLHPSMAHDIARRPKSLDALTQMGGNVSSDHGTSAV